ncbi:NUDIX domain-containing protein [Candidatus Lariskella endosymbiont of Hedychridium roseum]|uniref:NUDIX domain-containing protein n=1 Tax=Candidatus Lariskella endosymbiont of Hedychridium roseum TaxID=3077949 RepID=UPI0030D4DB29
MLHLTIVVPHLILRNGDKVFLSRRSQTQRFWPGRWHCVTGTIEDGETPQQAIMRETIEEIGIHLDIPPKLAVVVSLADSNNFIEPGSIFRSIEMFFLAELPNGQIPKNREPTKQDTIDWFSITNLPEPIIPVVKFGFSSFLRKESYGEFYNI